jgi:hypothetical protein
MEESDMYKVLINVIKGGSYELADILGKIDTLWLQGSLTDAERMERMELARSKAEPSHSFAPLQAQIDALAERVAALEGKVEPADPDAPAEEYPAYVQPTGAHDAYHAGDKVTFNGKRYICIAPEGVAVVWAPDVYPDYWEEVAK